MTPQDLAGYADRIYHATASLLRMAPEDKWAWKPDEQNSMNLGQLARHLTTATGVPLRGLVTGDWGMPAGAEVPPEELLPSADRLPSITKAEALHNLEDDRLLMHEMLDTLPPEDFDHRVVTAPWGESGPLWRMCLEMVEHQANHKMQLFGYLKRLGLPVATPHLYGMV